MDDLALLAGWRAGDNKARELLLKRYFDVLFRFFSNKVSGDVDDLVQQTMLALLKSRDQFENRSSFRSYILSIAKYQLYEFLRTKKRINSVFEYDTVTAFDLSPSPSSLAGERREQSLLLEALRRIPLNFQVALELHYWEELSGPELAEVLDVPVDTAYSRVRKARSLLKKQLRLLSIPAAANPGHAWESDLRAIARR